MKRHMGQCLGMFQVQSFQSSCPSVMNCVTFPPRMSDHVCAVSPARKASLNLSVQRFYWSSMVNCPGGPPWVPAPPESELTTGTQSPHSKSHC